MHDPSKLSRRERQIMDIVYAAGETTVRQVRERTWRNEIRPPGFANVSQGWSDNHS